MTAKNRNCNWLDKRETTAKHKTISKFVYKYRHLTLFLFFIFLRKHHLSLIECQFIH